MATVHVIDDDESMRTALGRLLGAAGYQVRTYAAAGDYLLPEASDEPGCLLLDLNLPGASGLDLQAALARHPHYQRPIIFLSGTADIPSSVRAMHAGAHDFLTKPVTREVLLAAVEDAVASDTVRRSGSARSGLLRQRLASLSERERKVLEGVAAGTVHKRIAASLGVSERTVKADRARMMEKLQADSLADLLRLLGDGLAGPSHEDSHAHQAS